MNWITPKEAKADLVQLENNMEKIYFDGCSYTFGQGLELYCNPLEKFEENRMSHYKFTNEDLEFMSKHRYSGIVSNHFAFSETNKSRNGKSNGLILFELKKENIDDYKYVIIQLTHFNRYFTNDFEWTGQPDTIEYYINKKLLTQEQVNYTIDNIENIQLNYFLELEKMFENCPEKLKIIFHSSEWKDILTKEQIQKYGISIDGDYIMPKWYMIRDWAEQNNMFINQQTQFKNHKASAHDTHLSMEGHKILAESIIKQI